LQRRLHRNDRAVRVEEYPIDADLWESPVAARDLQTSMAADLQQLDGFLAS
jgi:hypothetical protein